jgi:hypothetical protein
MALSINAAETGTAKTRKNIGNSRATISPGLRVTGIRAIASMGLQLDYSELIR